MKSKPNKKIFTPVLIELQDPSASVQLSREGLNDQEKYPANKLEFKKM